jgi:hypothetical protein
MATTLKTRKIKTKKVTIRLSLRQKMIIDRYCNAHDLTTNKFIKNSLKEFLVNNYDLDDDNFVSKNQLTLFDFEDDAIELENMDNEEEPEEQLQMMLF